MTLISSTIPNLINGVSQQPPQLRLTSQAEIQENAYSSVVDQLTKRPPFHHVWRIADSAYADDAFIHTINRDADEKYVVVISDGDLKIYDLAGQEKTVAFPGGKGYLASATPSASFAAATSADYTFIANKGVTVATDPASASGLRPIEAMVWLKQAAYSMTFTITVNGATVTHTTPDGSSPSTQGVYLATTYILAQLAASLAALAIPGISYGQYGSTLHIISSGALTVAVTDTVGDTYLEVFQGKAQRFSDLPQKAPNGFEIEIVGDPSSTFDNYYVRYDDTDAAAQHGAWIETLKRGELTALDATTMPHTLRREADGTFTFLPSYLAPRTCGDLDSNPFASCVGRKINDLFFHRNRLGYLADENVILSAAGDFARFHRGTVTQLLDDDPIDVACSHTKVSILRHALAWNEDLLLFSDQTQFILTGSPLLTPKSTSINVLTEYESEGRAKPVVSGNNVYFPTKRGGWATLREYAVDVTSGVTQATDVTAHAPSYVPSNIKKMTASSTEDVIVLLSANRPNELYLYKYFWIGSDKAQSSVSKWVLPESDTILNVEFISNRLIAVISRSNSVSLETCFIEPSREDEGMGYTILLDRRLHSSQPGVSYDGGTEKTTMVLPYEPLEGEFYEVYAGPNDPTYAPGQAIPFTVSGSTVTLEGDTDDFYWGRAYTMRYRLSTLYMRQSRQSGEVAITDGRLALKRLFVNFAKTGYFRVDVTAEGRPPGSYVFSGRVVSSGANVLDEVSLEDGVFPVPILTSNDLATIEIVNDKPLPSNILSASWEGSFTTRARHL